MIPPIYEKMYTRSNGAASRIYFKSLKPGGVDTAEKEVKQEGEASRELRSSPKSVNANVTYVRRDILNPLFNLREVLKNCLMLEDHLFQKDRRCGDCIKKHSMLIEGFLEEAISLDIKGEYNEHINSLIDAYKALASVFFRSTFKNEDFVRMAQGLRALRKNLVTRYDFFSAELLFSREILNGNGSSSCSNQSCSLSHRRENDI